MASDRLSCDVCGEELTIDMAGRADGPMRVYDWHERGVLVCGHRCLMKWTWAEGDLRAAREL